ncbi:lanthionine synthetase C family protein [Archangium violaceum]|uniref:lanthionine synthetase C family protein n=1 Tax=Archangium violaceum TaxID=83451 RepID=UPI0019502657|nr:lanthionine synthetase C family protein [Archangium violaceum]QRN99237.1 lanthionine synthetase C family protein [Archangium violaceum]
MKQWAPILEGTRAERALAFLRAVAEAFDAPAPEDRALSATCVVRSQQALWWHYLARAFPDEGHEERRNACLDEAIDALRSAGLGPALHEGLTGVAWVVEHTWGRESQEVDLNANIDGVLLETLAVPRWERKYDLISGLVGLGVYGLERHRRPQGHALVQRVFEHLRALAEPQPEGWSFRTPPQLLAPERQSRYPEGCQDLGVAHGVPGVIGFLARARSFGVGGEEGRQLLEGCVRWLLARRLSEEEAPGGFPALLAPGAPREPARSAWCYGNPGIAVTLLMAARHLGESSWEEAALAGARRAATLAPEKTGVVDAFLCHGAAGLGHLYNRLYQATDEALFLDAAWAWFDRALDLCGPEVPREERLLTGTTGIGLALLSAVTPLEPEWDRLLLMDIP